MALARGLKKGGRIFLCAFSKFNLPVPFLKNVFPSFKDILSDECLRTSRLIDFFVISC